MRPNENYSVTWTLCKYEGNQMKFTSQIILFLQLSPVAGELYFVDVSVSGPEELVRVSWIKSSIRVFLKMI